MGLPIDRVHMDQPPPGAATPTETAPQHLATPLLVYDGRCEFCCQWIGRWKQVTGDRVDYAPYQQVAQRFPQIPLVAFERAAQLIDSDGKVYGGAEAVFRALATVPGRGLGLWAYRKIPLLAPLARAAYRFVAGHRRGLSGLTNMLWGDHLGPSSYVRSRGVFVRAMGVVYLVAFLSLLVQIKGLVGSEGIIPAADFLEQTWSAYERAAAEGRVADARLMYLYNPTLCWINCEDWFLESFLCGGGVLLATLLVLGILPGAVALLLWTFYLSVTIAGQTFMHFQWDILLLEAGFLTILFAPWRLRLNSRRALGPSRIVLFLLHWLVFRLMFLSGVVKLNSGDASWINLEAMNYHYLTQPLPTWTAWYMHHLPATVQALACAGMFVVELMIPFLYFGPRRLKQFGALVTVGLMIAIAATGNYNFFGILTAALCIPLLDDASWRRFSFGRRRAVVEAPPSRSWEKWIRRAVVLPVGLLIVVVSSLQVYTSFSKTDPVREAYEWVLRSYPEHQERLDETYRGVRQARSVIRSFRSVNPYGLFRVMTKTRPEIIVEGSNDGREWTAYEFKWKPGDLARAPAFIQLHQPRLDWQIWFAALDRRRQWHWFGPMLERLLDGSPEVLSLLAYNPFPDAPPRYVRALYYDYQFTTFAQRSATGDWWRRQLRGVYARPKSKESLLGFRRGGRPGDKGVALAPLF